MPKKQNKNPILLDFIEIILDFADESCTFVNLITLLKVSIIFLWQFLQIQTYFI